MHVVPPQVRLCGLQRRQYTGNDVRRLLQALAQKNQSLCASTMGTYNK